MARGAGKVGAGSAPTPLTAAQPPLATYYKED